MDTLLLDGDFVPDLRGRPQAVNGLRELLQRCMIRLTVPRGSFACDPQLGSRLRNLPRTAPQTMNEVALAYISEALEDLPEVMPAEVKCSYDPERDIATVEITLELGTEAYKLEVEV